jgi:two-component system, OmpR family, sensor kinase
MAPLVSPHAGKAMSLTTRLLLFFLGTLALVLAGFSTTLYILARSYLTHQVDERLAAALDTLDAAVDREGPGLEWDAKDRHLTLGRDRGSDQVRWLVRDDRGRRVDASDNLDDPKLADVLRIYDEAEPPSANTGDGQTWRPTWRIVQRRVDGSAAVEGDLGPNRYSTLVLTAAVTLDPMHGLLRNLAVVLGALSITVWVLAALGGRLLCRRALLPVSRMALAARGISAAALDQRLPTLATGDELADLSRAFNDLLARLQESFERQQRFTGDASHQLRTPLTAMQGQVEVALRRPRSPEEYERVLGQVRDQSGRLRQIVEMLLFLARTDAESRPPPLERVDLPAWLRDHASTWADNPRIADLQMDLPADMPLWVDVHPPLLGQLVDNVWDNACKYSGPGTPIVLSAGRGPDGVFFSLEDRGCGVSEDEMAYVFEPFFRSRHARQTGVGGVGLGLAVVQRIAAVLGGKATFESTVGRGTTFRMFLPGRAMPIPQSVVS